MLKISPANAKTKRLQKINQLQPWLANGRKVYSLDMLSGWSCPGACECKSKVVCINGKRSLQDGPKTKFRCFSASQEVIYKNTYFARLHNFELMRSMRTVAQCRNLILTSLPDNAGIIRYHVAGDFFKLAYLRAAIEVAEKRPDILFYGYTKSLKFLQQIDMVNPRVGIIRPNFLMTISVGGKYDKLINLLDMRTAKVVFNQNETNGLPIDHDDSHAATIGGSFALLLHGIQPKGSQASEALRALNGLGSYHKKG